MLHCRSGVSARHWNRFELEVADADYTLILNGVGTCGPHWSHNVDIELLRCAKALISQFLHIAKHFIGTFLGIYCSRKSFLFRRKHRHSRIEELLILFLDALEGALETEHFSVVAPLLDVRVLIVLVNLDPLAILN